MRDGSPGCPRRLRGDMDRRLETGAIVTIERRQDARYQPDRIRRRTARPHAPAGKYGIADRWVRFVTGGTARCPQSQCASNPSKTNPRKGCLVAHCGMIRKVDHMTDTAMNTSDVVHRARGPRSHFC